MISNIDRIRNNIKEYNCICNLQKYIRIFLLKSYINNILNNDQNKIILLEYSIQYNKNNKILEKINNLLKYLFNVNITQNEIILFLKIYNNQSYLCSHSLIFKMYIKTIVFNIVDHLSNINIKNCNIKKYIIKNKTNNYKFIMDILNFMSKINKINLNHEKYEDINNIYKTTKHNKLITTKLYDSYIDTKNQLIKVIKEELGNFFDFNNCELNVTHSLNIFLLYKIINRFDLDLIITDDNIDNIDNITIDSFINQKGTYNIDLKIKKNKLDDILLIFMEISNKILLFIKSNKRINFIEIYKELDFYLQKDSNINYHLLLFYLTLNSITPI